jgi:hypothetical protein
MGGWRESLCLVLHETMILRVWDKIDLEIILPMMWE